MAGVVDHCTLWPEGVWAGCCEAHDNSALDLAAALDLSYCVAATGHIGMALVMVAGLIVFGPLYLFVTRRRSAQRPRDSGM